jgi:hypothetical protein
MTDQKMKDAIRTVGQLLLHRPTTGDDARDNNGNPVDYRSPNACCFCYSGATALVADKFKVPGRSIRDEVNRYFEFEVDWVKWDDREPFWRKNIALCLCEYGDLE